MNAFSRPNFQNDYTPKPAKPQGFILGTAPTALEAHELEEVYKQAAGKYDDTVFAKEWPVLIDVEPGAHKLLLPGPDTCKEENRVVLATVLRQALAKYLAQPKKPVKAYVFPEKRDHAKDERELELSLRGF